MASRDLTVRLLADPKNFQAGLLAAGKSMRVAQREAYLLEKQQQQTLATMSAAGQTFLTFGAVAAVGLGLAVKAAMDWESAWTGVLKTVEGTPAELAQLEAQLRDLAGILPATHTEIAAVAEAAGQLGIATKDIASFTQTMINMGETTNLTAEQAATAIAQMMNIMGVAASDAGKLASVIVQLGNDGASTEAEIMEMGLRLAAAGKIAGMTADEVLALSSTMASLGINAEAGGSSLSTVIMKISDAVNKGGRDLEKFASVAGVSSAEFAQAWRNNASGALDMVVQGLGDMSREGKNVFGVLQELGIQEILQRDALLRLANAQGLLTKNLKMANEEWNNSDALLTEALKRYDTTASRVAIARNQINDFAITMGETLLPIVADVVGFVGGLADAFNAMPDWLQTATVSIIGVATAAALLGGSMLKIIPKIAEFNAVIGGFGSRGGQAFTRALRGAGSFMMGPWGIAIAAAVTGLGIFAANQAMAAAEVSELSNSLDQQTGAITDNTKVMVAKRLQDEGVFAAARKLGISMDLVTEAAMGNVNAMEKVNEILASQEDEFTQLTMVEGDAITTKTDLGKAADFLTESISEQSDQMTEARLKNEELREAMGDTARETSKLTVEQQQLAEEFGISGDNAAQLDSELKALDEAIKVLLDNTFRLTKAESSFNQALDKLTESIAENGKAWDTNTEAGRENNAAMIDYIEATAVLADAVFRETQSIESATDAIDEQIDYIKTHAKEMGLSKEQTQSLIDTLEQIKAEYKSKVTMEGIEQAQRQINNLVGTLASAGRGIGIPIIPTGQRRSGYADGGFVSGPGTSRSDSIPAWLSDGEFVVNARATAQHRGLLEAINGGDNRFVTRMWKPQDSYYGAPFGGSNINVTVPAWTDRFNLNQVLQDLQTRML